MKVAFYMNCVSAHQLPLAKEVAKLVGAENFCYVDAGEQGQEYQSCHDTTGIQVKVKGEGEQWIEESDLLLTGLRNLELFERRAKKGLRTFYTSERWFKPLTLFDLRLFDCLISGRLPGYARMMMPKYRKMAKRFVKWANEDGAARVLAVGPWAKLDFLRMGVMEKKIVDWGYFVAPSIAKVGKVGVCGRRTDSALRVLWVGRMLDWKRVGDIVRTIREVKNKSVRLTLVGDGPEKARLKNIVRRCGLDEVVTFVPSQPPETIRELMRKHALYVLASNSSEGWGAVVSEALEEGMNVIGTRECGSCPTLLPPERLYSCGDVKTLSVLLEKEFRGKLPPCSIGEWTAKKAAKRLIEEGLMV